MSDHSHSSTDESELQDERNNHMNHTIQNRETRYSHGNSYYGTLDEMNEISSTNDDDSMTCLQSSSVGSGHRKQQHDDITSEDRIYGPHDPLLSLPRLGEDSIIEKALSSISSATNVSTTNNTKKQERSEPLTIVAAGAVANLCSATLGAGVLSLPFALYQAGIVFGGILLFATAWATVYSIDLIVAASHIYGIYTYEGLAKAALGKKIKFWLELSIVIFTSGVLVAYIIAVGDILEKSHLLIYNSRELTTTLVWCIAMVPLSMVRKMKSLQYASAFGIFSIGTLVYAAAIHLIQDESEADLNDGISSFDIELFASNISAVFFSCLWPSNGLISVLTACPIILFSFSCQCNVAAIFEELPEKFIKSKGGAFTSMTGDSNVARSSNTGEGDQRNQIHQGEHHPLMNASDRKTTTTIKTHPISYNSSGPEKQCIDANCLEKTSEIITKDITMHQIAVCAVCICSLLYTMISIIALSDFGKRMTPNMLSNYPPVGIMQVAMSFMAVAVVMAYPLNVFPSRVTITGWMLGTAFDDRFFAIIIDNSEEDEKNINKKMDSKPIGEAAALLVNSNNDIEDIAVAENFESNENSMTSAMSQQQFPQQLLPVSTTTTTTDVASNNTTKGNDDAANKIAMNFSLKRHLFLTFSLTISSLALALVLPNISVVFGLLGGTAASFLGFVIPGYIGLQLCRDLFGDDDTNNSNDNICTKGCSESCVNSTTMDICSSKQRLKCISWSLLVGGACICVLTPAVTLFNMFVPV